MRNSKGKPICGATVTGPIVKDGGRSRPLWRRSCKRVVAEEGCRCWQHRLKAKYPARQPESGPDQGAM